VWNTANGGSNALLTYAATGLGLGSNAIWNVDTGLTVPYLDSATSSWVSNLNQANFFEGAVNEDGTSVGGVDCQSPCGAQDFGFKDINLNVVGFVWEPAADPTYFGNGEPSGDQFHPSGALFYEARNGATGLVDIVDTHQWQVVETVALPENVHVSLIGPGASELYSQYSQHILATDPTGQYIFAVTASGITEMVLDSVPLSIGNIQPAFVQAPGSQTYTIRGSGFLPGAVVSFGGTAAASTYVDVNTLTATPTSLSPGWTDISVTLPGGAS
jgi:hypothetical protein